MEGALRRPWWVRGRRSVRGSLFLVLREMNLFFLFLKYRPTTGAWEYHRPHCCSPLFFAIVRTAALAYCCPVIIWVFSTHFCLSFFLLSLTLLISSFWTSRGHI